MICIIDDDDVYQYTATKAIEEESIAKKILVFSEGEQAIQFLIDNMGNDDEIPDIIFLDIVMPVMDGWEFMEEYIKLKPRIGKKITIYMVSSSVDVSDIERAKKIEEITDYIIKPITRSHLKIIVEDIMKEFR